MEQVLQDCGYRGEKSTRTVSNHECTLCAELRFKNDDCVRDEKICMMGVESNKVIEWLEKFKSGMTWGSNTLI